MKRRLARDIPRESITPALAISINRESVVWHAGLRKSRRLREISPSAHCKSGLVFGIATDPAGFSF